jgi:hypothetical protein
LPEPFTLGAIVAALIAKSMSRVEDSAVQTGAEVLRKAVTTVRDWFAREGDKEGQQILDGLEGMPESPALTGALSGVLDDRAERFPDLRSQLEALRNEAEEVGIEIRVNEQTAIGNGNIQIEAQNSQVNVNRGSSSAPDN